MSTKTLENGITLLSLAHFPFADAHKVQQAIQTDAGNGLVGIFSHDRFGMKCDAETGNIDHR